MRRVYVVYWTKRVLRPVYLKSTFLLACLFGVTTFISVRHVFQNLLTVRDLSAALRFAVDALTSTESKVQLLVVLAGIVFLWLAADMLRSDVSKSLSYEQTSKV